MQEVYFPVLFPEYIPPEGLEEALAQLLVTAAEVDQAARSIRLTGTSGVYIAQRRLREVEDALRHRYGLRECAIAVRYPESLLPQMEFRDLAQVLIRAYSPAAAILARGEVGTWTATSCTSTLPRTARPRSRRICRRARPSCRNCSASARRLCSTLRRSWRAKRSSRDRGCIRQEAIKNSPAVAVAAAAVQKMKAASGRPILPAATPI